MIELGLMAKTVGRQLTKLSQQSLLSQVAVKEVSSSEAEAATAARAAALCMHQRHAVCHGTCAVSPAMVGHAPGY